MRCRDWLFGFNKYGSELQAIRQGGIKLSVPQFCGNLWRNLQPRFPHAAANRSRGSLVEGNSHALTGLRIVPSRGLQIKHSFIGVVFRLRIHRLIGTRSEIRLLSQFCPVFQLSSGCGGRLPLLTTVKTSLESIMICRLSS